MGDVFRLQLIANPDETRATWESKREELNTAIEKNTLKRNCLNKKLYHERQKDKTKEGKI